MAACEGLKLLAKLEAIELGQLIDIPTGTFHDAVIVRARTRKLAKELGINFVTLAFCPVCGFSASNNGEPLCVPTEVQYYARS